MNLKLKLVLRSDLMRLDDAVAKPMKDNQKITKRVVFPNNKEVPHVLMFAESTLPAGERNPIHVHKDAFEVLLLT